MKFIQTAIADVVIIEPATPWHLSRFDCNQMAVFAACANVNDESGIAD